jgi:predicted DNA repair protein MutK
VALLVKADDFGLLLAQSGRLRTTRRVGRAIVAGMPGFLKALTTVGTAAMLWVGGSIVVHGLHDLGWDDPYNTIHHAAEAAAHAVPVAEGAVTWAVTALLDGICGLALGFVLIPVATYVLAPLAGIFSRKPA